MKDDLEAGEYIQTLMNHSGVAVVTVDDGWIFTFNRQTLQALIDSAPDKDSFMIFVKSSAKAAKN